MITRFALFISLLALFYYYCKNDSTGLQPQNDNINLIESPSELTPGINNEISPETIINSDTSHFISGHLQNASQNRNQFTPVAQNY